MEETREVKETKREKQRELEKGARGVILLKCLVVLLEVSRFVAGGPASHSFVSLPMCLLTTESLRFLLWIAGAQGGERAESLREDNRELTLGWER